MSSSVPSTPNPPTTVPFMNAAKPRKPLSMSNVRSLGVLLAIPFVAQIGLLVLFAWFTVRTEQDRATETASRLSQEVSTRIVQNLESYLEIPQQVNQININVLETGQLNLQDLDQWQPYLFEQLRLFDALSYIYLGQAEGRYVGLGRRGNDPEGLEYAIVSDPERGFLDKYGVNSTGRLSPSPEESYAYDPRQRPWYERAATSGQPSWSGVYLMFANNPDPDRVTLGISLGTPYLDASGNVQSVLGADLTLTQITQLLQELKFGESGQIFIMEPSGALVASSTIQRPFDDANERMNALELTQAPTIQSTTKALEARFGSLDQVQDSEPFAYDLGDQTYLAQVTRFRDDLGLDWLIVVTAPQAEFLGDIAAEQGQIFLLGATIAGVTGILAVLTYLWITRPIARLSKLAEVLARGFSTQPLEKQGIRELDQLAQSFNEMAVQLQASIQALENTNLELETRVQERTFELEAATAASQHENEVLQTEVAHLLDVVSALEDGDLTVQAQVSDRATGLVADTLNRLIEELGRVLSETFYSTQQVSEGADSLQQMAALVTENTEFQVRSVTQVQALMEQVDRLAQSTTQQAVESNEAVEQAEGAVHQGQEQMARLTQGLAQLQERTEQITQRSITLSNFVQLAEQFVQDQRRIASLTRVLALNASMIAARAAGQTDPDQFASVAREFETIATQVNNLAVQTNQGLMVLQQRTSQIQTVVSGVNQDVDEITQVVTEFSHHTQATDHSFGEISTATRQVVAITQEVLQSSRTISSAAQNTLDSIRGITTSASETAHQAGLTRQQVSRMQGLVSALLDRVEFFKLPPELMDHQPQTGPAPLPTPGSIPPLNPGDPQRVANGRQPSPSLASSPADS